MIIIASLADDDDKPNPPPPPRNTNKNEKERNNFILHQYCTLLCGDFAVLILVCSFTQKFLVAKRLLFSCRIHDGVEKIGEGCQNPT